MNSDWTNLPKEILYMVLEKLDSPLDFSSVCMPWRSATKDTQSHCAMMGTPLLLISGKEKGIWNLYNVVDDKVLKSQVRLPRNRFCGSSKGWLIFIDENCIISLINPFFRVNRRKEKPNSIIRLPPLIPPNLMKQEYPKRRYDYYVFKATISADPISNANDCTIMVIYEGSCQLAFIRLHKDNKWTFADKSIDRSWRLIFDVAQFEDKFYAVDHRGKLFSFQFAAHSIVDVELVADATDDLCSLKRYLVLSSEKKVLMVQRYTEFGDKRVTKKFRMFELNSSKREWIEKKELGDVALFVGENSTISVSASKFGCQPNCIYFSHDNDRAIPFGNYDCGMYDIGNDCILNPSTKAKTLLKKTRIPSIWILPTYLL